MGMNRWFLVSILIIFTQCKQKSALSIDESLTTYSATTRTDSNLNSSKILVKQIAIDNGSITSLKIKPEITVDDVLLSKISSRVEYYVINLPKIDTTIYRYADWRFALVDNYILGYSAYYGILLFNNDGKFNRYLLKNEFNYISAKQGKAIAFNLDNQFKGVKNYPSVINKHKIAYIKEENGICHLEFISFDHGQISTTNNQKIQFLSDLAFENRNLKFLNETLSVSFFDTNSLANGRSDVIEINATGDTLATKTRQLTQAPKISSYKKVEDVISYYFNKNLNFISDFGDTLFSIKPNGDMEARYLLDFANRVKFKNTFNRNYSFKNDIILSDIIETPKYLFILFTINTFDRQTVENSKVHIGKAIIEKTTNIFLHCSVENSSAIIPRFLHSYPVPIGIRNNIDHGVPIWPRLYIEEDNKIITWYRKDEVIKLIESQPNMSAILKKYEPQLSQMSDYDFLLISLTLL